MNQRPIKFRAWMPHDRTLRYNISATGKPIDDLDEFFALTAKDGLVWMQFTGLLDKGGLAEVYEGDIIDSEGNIKGNTYESPQIYEAGVDCLIEGMGTSAWRNTESVAVGRGCKYAE